MAKLNTTKKSATDSVILYGAPKAGKTLLAGKLAEHFNLIWFDLENGHATLYTLPEKWQERIELITFNDTTTYPIAIETCLKVVKGPVDICEAHGKVACTICKRKETSLANPEAPEESEAIHNSLFTHVDLANLPNDTIVVFDSATQLTSSAIAHITKAEADDYKMKTDDWGGLSKLMDVFFSHIQNATYNVIVISHLVETKQDDGKKSVTPVAGSKNFSANVAKCFDHVIFAQRKNCKHAFASTTTYANNILTGSRTGVDMDNDVEASLLSVFKPEVVPEKKQLTSSSAAAGTSGASSLLSRLKDKT